MIILIGESGSGKSTVERQLTSYGFERAISHTTRPMREGEQNDVDYHFVSVDEFKKMLDDGEFLEHVEFNGNFYGLHKSNVRDEVVAVVEPKGMKQLSEIPNIHITSVYLKASEELRRERMLSRGDSEDAVEKRIENDRDCFKGLEDLVTYTVDVTEDDTVREVTNKVLASIYKDLPKEMQEDIDTVQDILRPVRFFPNAVAALMYAFVLVALAVLIAIGVDKIFPHTTQVDSYSLSQVYTNEDGMLFPEEMSKDEKMRETDFIIWDTTSNKEISAKGYKIPAGYYYFECENGVTLFTKGKGHNGYDYDYFVVGNEAVKVTDISSLSVENCGKIIHLTKPAILQTMGACTVYSSTDEVILTSKVTAMLADSIKDTQGTEDTEESTSDNATEPEESKEATEQSTTEAPQSTNE